MLPAKCRNKVIQKLNVFPFLRKPECKQLVRLFTTCINKSDERSAGVYTLKLSRTVKFRYSYERKIRYCRGN